MVARRMKRRPLATASVHASTDQAQASPNSKVVSAESSTAFLNVRRKSYDRTVSALEKGDADGSSAPLLPQDCDDPHDDRWNYALLLALYTLQGIPMGLSASIPCKYLKNSLLLYVFADMYLTISSLQSCSSDSAESQGNGGACGISCGDRCRLSGGWRCCRGGTCTSPGRGQNGVQCSGNFRAVFLALFS